MSSDPVKVLLVEDDEDDYTLVRLLLSEVSSTRYDLDRVDSYESALHVIGECRHHVYLFDYSLGKHNGLELLNWLQSIGCRKPAIFLTGHGDYRVDVEAMKSGAADYLVKDHINAPLLDRSIRYAIERMRTEDVLIESQRQLKYLSSQLIMIQEHERQKIAAELHDSLGQILTAVKLGIEDTIRRLDDNPEIRRSLETFVPTIQSAIDEVRGMYMQLRPTLLDDLGIMATIGWFCREFEKNYPHITVEKNIYAEEEDIPEHLKVVIYRLIQEALNNATRHGGANWIELTLDKIPPHGIELTIHDNGQGFEVKEIPAAGRHHLGLATMRARTEHSGGKLTIESSPETGTTLTAIWPA